VTQHVQFSDAQMFGSLLYIMYTVELAHVVSPYETVTMYQYKDDCRVYVSTNVVTAVAKLTVCLADVSAWLRASRLHLNPMKTHVMWLGLQQ